MTAVNDMHDDKLEEYYREAESWSEDRQGRAERSVRLAWIVAASPRWSPGRGLALLG